MKTVITLIAVALTAFAAGASELVPYIAMPVNIGYATDAKGVHQPNALCMRDAVFAPHPQYPYHPKWESHSMDPGTWTRDIKGDGLYRLDIDPTTARVSQITIIKSTGSTILDAASTSAFKRWVFKPGKWKEIIVPTTVRTHWIGVTTTRQ